jgi:osmoprotectant transport system ATP-binding protein
MPSAKPPPVKVEAVCKSYGGHAAVGRLDLTVPAGQFVALIGESGSGKTTLLKMINRLIEPDSGRVLIDGVPTDAQPGHLLRRHIGYVFQQVGLFPHLTIAQNIGITPDLLGWPRERIAERVVELLDLVNLPREYSVRLPSALSGGQRQRVGVARALAGRPAIMLMDEPFGALDPVTRDALGTEYRRLHENMQLTTLMVTHDVLEAVLLADRIVMLRAGEIVADGSPHELMSAHGDDGVRSLMDMPRRQALRVAKLLEAKSAHG